MEYLIILFIIITQATALTIRFKRKIEETIPSAVILMVLIVYLFGLIDKLYIGFIMLEIVFFLSLAFILYAFIQSICQKQTKKMLKRIFTPGLVAYIFLYILFIIFNHQRIFTDLDEFNHWAVITKYMYVYKDLGLSETSIIEYTEYPPFTAIFQNLFLQIKGSFSEDTVIIASNILYFSIIIQMLSKIKWNKTIFYLILLIPLYTILPIIFFQEFYVTILVDGFIGILFGCILYRIYTRKNGYDDLLITLELIAMGLTKTEGIGLAIGMLIFFIIMTIQQKNKNQKQIQKIILITIIFGIFIGAWYGKIAINGVEVKWQSTTENIATSQEKRQIATNYFNSFLNTRVTAGIGFTPCGLLLLTLITNLFLYQKVANKNRYKKISIALWILNIVYLLALVLTYLYILPTKESKMLASFARYINTILIANVIFHIGVLLKEVVHSKERLYRKIGIIGLCILAIFPFSEFQEQVIYGKNEKTQAIVNRKTYVKIQNYQEQLTKEDKILYINTETSDYENDFKVARYLMMPIQVEKIDDLTKENFINTLKENHYTYVYIFNYNDELAKDLTEIFEDKLENNILYKVTEDTKLIKIQEN